MCSYILLTAESLLTKNCFKMLKTSPTKQILPVIIPINQRCADCGRGYPRTQIRRFSCGRSADPPNKHICGRGPSADLKPWVLFAGSTSKRSASVPVLINFRTDPYLDTAVGYVGKPVWLCGALGIVCWIQCNCNPTLLVDADGPRTWCLRTRIIRGREICGSAHLCH